MIIAKVAEIGSLQSTHSLMVSLSNHALNRFRTRRYGVSTNHNVSTQNPGKVNRTLVQLIFRTTPFLLAVFRCFTRCNRYLGG